MLFSSLISALRAPLPMAHIAGAVFVFALAALAIFCGFLMFVIAHGSIVNGATTTAAFIMVAGAFTIGYTLVEIIGAVFTKEFWK